MPYSPLLIKPMRDEATDVGVVESLAPADVDSVLGGARRDRILILQRNNSPRS